MARRLLGLSGALLVLLAIGWTVANMSHDTPSDVDRPASSAPGAPPATIPGLEGRARTPKDAPGAATDQVPMDDLGSETWRGTTTVRVVSAVDGSPIGGALVRVSLWVGSGEKGESRESLTDRDGRASLPATWRPARWLIRKRGYLTIQADGGAMRDASPESPISLTPAAALAGRVVVAGSGTGVPGARVVAWLTDDWSAGGLDEPQTTDARGAFEVAGVPSDRSLRVAAAADGYGSVIVSLAPGAGRQPLEIALGGGAVLRGTVRDAKGAPVPDAAVFVSERGGDDPLGDPRWDHRRGIRGDEVGLLRTRARSGPDGRFGVRGLATPAAYVLAASTSSGAIGRSGPISLRDPGAQADQDITVAATGTITVTFANLPPNAGEWLTRSGLWRDGAASDVPDPQKGRWQAKEGVGRFEAVPAGAHRVFFDPPDFVAAAGTVDVRPGEDATVRFGLDPGFEVSGRLVDEEGRPVEGFVWFTAERDSLRYARSSWASSDGSFTLRALPRVAGTLTARSDGRFGEAERTDVLPGAGVPQTMTLTRGATLVWRWPRDFSGAREIGYVATEGPRHTYREAGGVHHTTRLDGVPPGVALLVYAKVGGSPPILRHVDPVAAGATLDLGELAFPEPCTLRGTVRDIRAATVVGARIRSIDPWSDGEALTGADGAFRLAPLPPGPTSFVVEVDGVLRAHMTIEMRAADPSTEVVLPDPGRIEATIRDRQGDEQAALPLDLVPLEADGSKDWRRRVIVRTDSVGHLEATVEPGRYRLEPHSSTKGSWASPVPDLVVASGQTLSLDLTVEPSR